MLIQPEHLARLAAKFEQELAGSVVLRLALHRDECALCRTASELAADVASTSTRIDLVIDTDVPQASDALPVMTLEGRARGVARFVGPPAGFELPAFIDSIVDVSSGRSGLSDDAVQRLARLSEPTHIRVFTTPT